MSAFNAVIFDLDGVITKTALVHSAAWKKVFDGFLKDWSSKHNRPFCEFDHERDYLPYIDGLPRYQGVQSFLEHRGIGIPYGDPSDPPDAETICGLGNRKNQVFNEVLEQDGAEVYQSTVTLIHQLIKRNIRVGVASSSKNCEGVLKAAGLLDLFETRVDGVVSAELGLSGKPAPDIFLQACKNLGSTPDKAVVVEDAVSGVQAGRAGNFGLALGIARENNAKDLHKNGADLVVNDIENIGLSGIEEWFEKGLEENNRSLIYKDYDQKKERSREALLTVGNGYFGTRGAFEETIANPVNYPGTYITGLYNRLISNIGGRKVENEDFVNIPNWLQITFKIDDGDWFDPNEVEIRDCYRRLDFRIGILERVLTIRDKHGKETLIRSQRLAGMSNPHLAALKYSISPMNYHGKITVKSSLNGNNINDGVDRYKQLNQRHLAPLEEGAAGNLSWLAVKTTQSAIEIAEAVKLIVLFENKIIQPEIINKTADGLVESTFSADLERLHILTVEKIAAIYTSKPDDTPQPLPKAKETAQPVESFDHLAGENETAWRKIWEKIDIQIEGDRLAQKLLRLHLYHLMVSFSPHNKNFDAGITARGLHGEAYRGHIFWDELFILPLYAMHFPEAAKAMLMYRYRRLDKARAYAQEHGHKGAMFPWQSGSDGREETQTMHLNPVTGKWGADNSSLQRHVSLAVAYNTWQYLKITGDHSFIREYGAEMFFEICRFWASKAEKDEATGRYSIRGVMGPDEFHEAYPNATSDGLKDNTYTNLMVAWTMERAFDLLNLFKENEQQSIKSGINLTDEELSRWKDISQIINIVMENDILAQYDGYFELKELDWDFYKKKYGNIHRMDRLLKAEGKSPDEYKVSKQADTLMTFYNLPEKEVTLLLERSGYKTSPDYLKRNLEYYLQRTSHGSTLSGVVHAHLANMTGDKKLSWELYRNALTSDYNDIQGGTTGEGIHTGVMAGTLLVAIQSYAGVDIRDGKLSFSPALPDHWQNINFNIGLKDDRFFIKVTPNYIELTMRGKSEKTMVSVQGRDIMINNEESLVIKY